jgi:segregation and condensation protein A
LVRRLLEYKKFKDAASMLEERGRGWQERFPRMANDLPSRERNLADQEIQEVELWDLVSALGRMMREIEATRPSNIVYDDTPIHVYMAQIKARLQSQGKLAFRELFRPEMHKSAMIGIFLAILELVRHHHVRAEQRELFGELWLLPGAETDAQLDVNAVDSYDHGPG